MGGAGAGRSGGRPVIDGCRSLDVNRLHREGWLRPGWTGTLRVSLKTRDFPPLRQGALNACSISAPSSEPPATRKPI